MIAKIAAALAEVRGQNPLIHQITNFVSMNDCANVTLAIGASPVMTQDASEVEEMVAQARALVINLGTLQSQGVSAMFAAARRAGELSIPVALDPVGVGGTRHRTAVAKRFISEMRPVIIRCNMSELKALCGVDVPVKGVDSAADGSGGAALAAALARQSGAVVAVTGGTDIVTDGERMLRIVNGHPLMARVTGMGCMATALTACFAAVVDPLTAAAGGILSMGISGELAAAALREKEGPGMFRVRFMDAAYLLNRPILELYARLTEETAE